MTVCSTRNRVEPKSFYRSIGRERRRRREKIWKSHRMQNHISEFKLQATGFTQWRDDVILHYFAYCLHILRTFYVKIQLSALPLIWRMARGENEGRERKRRTEMNDENEAKSLHSRHIVERRWPGQSKVTIPIEHWNLWDFQSIGIKSFANRNSAKESLQSTTSASKKTNSFAGPCSHLHQLTSHACKRISIFPYSQLRRIHTLLRRNKNCVESYMASTAELAHSHTQWDRATHRDRERDQ